MTVYNITPGDPRKAGDIALVIAEAFKPLAVAEWLARDEKKRVKMMSAQFEMFVQHAFAHGEVWTALDGQAAAVWFRRPMPDIPDYDERLAEICGDHLPRFQALDKAFDEHHPKDQHHHLAFLAVTRRLQGHLIGSTLLHHHLAHLDKTGQRAYLEASDRRSQGLYLRSGFVNLGPAIELPEGGPEMYPMQRTPRRGRDAL